MNKPLSTFTSVAICLSLCGSSIANPINPNLRNGTASFDFSTPGMATIHQQSTRAIIHWESFSIDSGETTRFIQPSSSSAALNRVLSGAPSAIYGNLQSNGQVFLINPNGIVVGPGGRIDTGGFLASTLDVSDADFLGGGDMTFRGNSTSKVVNMGTITSISGGDIFLIAKEVENHGQLTAMEGPSASPEEQKCSCEPQEPTSGSPSCPEQRWTCHQ